ncbi:MAG: type IV pilus assembly protein PilM [Candidatus Pacebacteria bacterium]|nr:type IV pilus assembly protein PilM [Candidatus Paceibacterota bacterium]
MPALALDVGTYTIKAISGKPGKKPVIEKTAEIFNSAGVNVPTDDAQAEKLSQIIDQFITDHKLPRSDLRLSFPETVVSTKIIEMPPLSDAELASAIGWQAEQHIPIPQEDLALEYQVLFRPPRKESNAQMRVLMIGTRKNLVDRFTNMFIQIGIEPKLLETQMLSTLRSLGFTENEPTTLVAHLGATNMDLAVVYHDELSFVFTHMTGGQLLTKTLAQNLNLDAKQAEEYKRAYGLDPQQFEGKVRNALLPGVKQITNEMQKAVRFFVNQHPQESIQRVILAGGGAQLNQLPEHLTQELGIEVLLAAPFATASGEIPPTNHLAMTVAAGLLMREL